MSAPEIRKLDVDFFLLLCVSCGNEMRRRIIWGSEGKRKERRKKFSICKITWDFEGQINHMKLQKKKPQPTINWLGNRFSFYVLYGFSLLYGKIIQSPHIPQELQIPEEYWQLFISASVHSVLGIEEHKAL